MIGNDHVRFGRGSSGAGPTQGWHLARRPTSRRLLKHEFIERIPRTHRYRVTTTGMAHALFLTRVHRNVLNSGMAQITQPDTRLYAAAREFDKAFDDLLARAHLRR